MEAQRGSADPQAIGTTAGGGIVAAGGFWGVNEWVAIGGLIVSLLSLVIYAWRSRRMVQIARQQLREQQEHHRKVRGEQ